jgi:hypothetical protein
MSWLDALLCAYYWLAFGLHLVLLSLRTTVLVAFSRFLESESSLSLAEKTFGTSSTEYSLARDSYYYLVFRDLSMFVLAAILPWILRTSFYSRTILPAISLQMQKTLTIFAGNGAISSVLNPQSHVIERCASYIGQTQCEQRSLTTPSLTSPSYESALWRMLKLPARPTRDTTPRSADWRLDLWLRRWLVVLDHIPMFLCWMILSWIELVLVCAFKMVLEGLSPNAASRLEVHLSSLMPPRNASGLRALEEGSAIENVQVVRHIDTSTSQVFLDCVSDDSDQRTLAPVLERSVSCPCLVLHEPTPEGPGTE